MSQLLRILLFSIIGATMCMALTEMPKPGESRRMRRGPSDNWPAIYPTSITTYGGVYADRSNGEYTIQDEYNDRPVYKGPGTSTSWSIYYRVSGYATNQWVLDFNDVSEDWDGTVAIQSTLFGMSEAEV